MSKKEPPQSVKKSSLKKSIKSIGPVESLENYLEKDWWRKIFNSMYLKTDADVVNDSDITKKEIDLFLDVLNIKSDAVILDLCCGHGRHSLELARRGFNNIRGLDRSHYLIQKAKQTAKKEGLKVKFREGDARKIPFSDNTFDVVMILGNSFGYFDSVEDDIRILKEVFRVLKPSGKILIDVSDGDYLRQNYQSRSWEWIDKKYFVCRERSLTSDKQRLISREIISHIEKGVVVDQFYAERLYNKEVLLEILSKAGFKDISFNADLLTESKRNQDLGMMERRIVVTGLCRKEVKIKPLKKENIKKIVVLLGDPSKSDIIKPNNVFDEDDFYTINQLKTALSEVQKKGNYTFSYLCNHNTFIQDLTKLKEKNSVDLVFNLCDEGYYNDPRKELHVPALCEILGIKYTGGNPQCLAYCYDKSLVRGIAKEMGIPTPNAFFIKPEDVIYELSFDFPVIIKPNFGDSSFGITQKSVAYNIEQLVNAVLEIREKLGYDKPILVEEFLTGKDISVGIIGNPPESYAVLPIVEEDYSKLPPELPKICGYEAKWIPDSPYATVQSIPANLPEETEKILINYCVQLFERLECKDYARFDFRLDSNGNPKLLEVNPNPGWCWDGHLAKMAKIAGMPYYEMLEAILQAAIKRIEIESYREEQKDKEVVG